MSFASQGALGVQLAKPRHFAASPRGLRYTADPTLRHGCPDAVSVPTMGDTSPVGREPDAKIRAVTVRASSND